MGRLSPPSWRANKKEKHYKGDFMFLVPYYCYEIEIPLSPEEIKSGQKKLL